jgi:hypothetical protein
MLKRLSALAKPLPQSSNQPERRARHHYFGWAGLCVGLLALSLALLPGWVAPMYDPPSKPIQQKASDWLEELKERAVAAIKMETVPLPPAVAANPWRDRRIALASVLLAFLALVAGVLAFVRHEEQRLVACAVALGAGAIAAQFLLTAAMILAFAVLVGAMLARYG